MTSMPWSASPLEDDLKAAFGLFTQPDGVSVKVADCVYAVEALGLSLDADAVQQLDPKHTGTVDWPTFRAAMTRRLEHAHTGQEAGARAFRLFDRGDKGYITSEDLDAVAKDLGEALPAGFTRHMVEYFDTKNTGVIDEQEFLGMLLR